MSDSLPNVSGLRGRQLVLASCVGLVILSFYRATTEGQSGLYRRLWGTGVLAVFLSILADFAPQVAGPFALLTLLGSLSNGGDRAIQSALSGLAAKGTAPSAPRAPQTARQTTTTAGHTG